MEREHVSIMMCRKLCGCKSSRIEEANKDENQPSSSYPSAAESPSSASVPSTNNDTTTSSICVLVSSSRILSRGLLGVLISSLEEKSLRTLGLSITSPSTQQLKTLNSRSRFSSISFPVAVSAWTGVQVYDRVRQTVTEFIQRYALEKGDIYMSDNRAHGKRDYYQTWFSSPITTQPSGLSSIEEKNDEKLPVVTTINNEHTAITLNYDDQKLSEITNKEEPLVHDLGESFPEDLPEASDADKEQVETR